MDIPALAHEKFGGTLELYRDVYKYSSMFLTLQEIADLTSNSLSTIKTYSSRLKQIVTELPPTEMHREAIYGYLNVSDMMMQDMMQLYMIAREDFEIFRNNIKRTDGKRSVHVQIKDLVALQNNIKSGSLERSVVLSKFAAANSQNKALSNGNSSVPSVKQLTSTEDADIIEVEVEELELN